MRVAVRRPAEAAFGSLVLRSELRSSEMTLGVVGESWGVVQQAASPGLPISELSDMARDPHALRLHGLAHVPLQPDVNAADSAWEADDYGVSDEYLPLSARASAPPGDGLLPGLLPEVSNVDMDLPLFKNIQTQVADFDPDADAIGSSSLEDDDADAESLASDKDIAEQNELPDLPDDDFDFEAGTPDEPGAYLLEERDARALSWDAVVELPDFDPDARVVPWTVPAEADDTARRKARLKAAGLAAVLDLTTTTEVEKATGYLVDFYCRHRHPSTHGALMRLADEDLDLDTLKAMVELRLEWAQRPDWWLFRHKGEVRQVESCLWAMTWRLAHDVCRSRSEFPPESMIDEDWADEWHNLRFGAPGYFSFADLIAEKVDSREAGLLYDGLRQAPGDHRDSPDPGDHHSDLHRANAARRES